MQYCLWDINDYRQSIQYLQIIRNPDPIFQPFYSQTIRVQQFNISAIEILMRQQCEFS